MKRKLNKDRQAIGLLEQIRLEHSASQSKGVDVLEELRKPIREPNCDTIVCSEKFAKALDEAFDVKEIWKKKLKI